MTNLVIDIGNTLTKIGIFEDDELQKVAQHEYPGEDGITAFLDGVDIDNTMVSSVKTGKEPWQALLKGPVTYFNSSITAGINNLYKSPQTLGTDRLAAVIGANRLFPHQTSIVISGGTCITYDCIDARGNYFGGSISPGLNMRYKAVNAYTAALPLLQADLEFDQPYGTDTASAVRSGVQNGIKYELKGFIESYLQTNQEYNIILSGGDSIFFDTLLKNSIFAPYIKIEPHLVLKGLNAAIKHND